MSPAVIVLLVAVFVLFLVLSAIARSIGKQSSAGAYQALPHLLSKAERSFYGVLAQAVGSTGTVFAKVRVADVISPRKGLGRAGWQRAFNAISAKHFDFVVCDPNTSAILLAVELDDSSHNTGRGRARDDLVNKACASAGVPLLRVKAAPGYVLTEIRRQALALMAISPGGERPGDSEPQIGSLTLGESTITAPVAAPDCPTCGGPMVLRKAKSGSNAGSDFWGCSNYPRCRGMRPRDWDAVGTADAS